MEIWKDIPGYEGSYQASNLGRIKSLERTCYSTKKHNHKRLKKETIRKQTVNKHGYNCVLLSVSLERKLITVHRLVILSFKENPSKKQTVNHIDGNKLNNHIENLEWATWSENSKHSFDIGLQKPRKGIYHHNVKLTEEQVLGIRKLKGKYKEKEIALMYGITKGHVGAILRRMIWKHI